MGKSSMKPPLLKLFYISLSLLWITSCASGGKITPPQLSYQTIADRFFREYPGGHLPLTVQIGVNREPESSDGQHLYYVSNRNGSLDIWMRDLTSTVNLPVVVHASDIYMPASAKKGTLLVFVSNEEDIKGNLRIVKLNPEEMKSLYLRGLTKQNQWDQTRNLSLEIEKFFEKDNNPSCRGKAAERYPHLSEDGKHLLYASDRCSTGRSNLWLAELNGVKLVKKPMPLTSKGATQGVLNSVRQRIAYVTYPDENSTGEIHLLHLADGKDIKVPLPTLNDKGQRVIHYSPSLSWDGSNVYYLSVREDSNRDGTLDLRDHAALYTYPIPDNLTFKENQEEMLLDASRPLFSASYSKFAGGTLIYSAALKQGVNIYYIPQAGIIPKKESIDLQYASIRNFTNTNSGRYLLAVDSVRRYFKETPLYFLFEGRLLGESISRFNQDGNKKGAEKSLQRLAQISTRNPYALIQYDQVVLTESRVNLIKRMEELKNKIHQYGYTKQEIPLVTASLLEDLAQEYIQAARITDAYRTFAELNRRFPNYYRNDITSLLEGKLYLQLYKKIPEIYIKFLGRENISLDQTDQILNSVYDTYLNDYEVKLDSSLPASIFASLQLVKAQQMYTQGDLPPALELLKEGRGKLPRGSGVWIRSWRMESFIQEKLGKRDLAYQARMEYGGNYRQESGVEVEPEEFQDIIAEWNRQIQRYYLGARSLYNTIAIESDETSSPLINVVQPFQNVANKVEVSLNAGDRDLLFQMCRPGSQDMNIYLYSGQIKYYHRYNAFCKQVFPAVQKGHASLGVELLKEGGDLLYVASYVTINNLNILFMHMRKVHLFEDIYQKHALKLHRRKIDIVVEANRMRLEYERKKILAMTADELQKFFVATDPFDASSFNELSHFYKLGLPEAQLYGDNTILYGYAYLLMQKSMERERFYDQARSRDILIPENLLREKKLDALANFKNAEYQLLYTLYTDPQYADAYTLLGWMYQYIDQRKSQTILTKPGFTEKVFNYATGTKPHSTTDGRFFSGAYSRYFSENLYEANIDLYRMALENSENIASSEQARIRLNMANNYFQLLNFQKALEQYDLVEEARVSKGESIFFDYRQSALFHFHRGRSLYYQNRFAEADKEFQTTFNIYSENEVKPALDQWYSIRKFEGDDKNNKTDPSKETHSEKYSRSEVEKKLGDVQLKLALILSLRGLVLWEAGKYDRSILAYKKGEQFLSNIKSTSTSDMRINLLNFISLSYQNLFDYKRSTDSALLAQKLLEHEPLIRYDQRYQPETLLGRGLGCLIKYGEDFSVIGEGRNPYGFSPLRQYELSLGIQLENSILGGDVEEAFRLLSERETIFKKKDGDVTLGKTGELVAKNQRGTEFLSIGNLNKSMTEYRDAADLALKIGDLKRYRLNTSNYYAVLFERIETNPHDETISLLKKEFGRIDSFRASYREKTKLQYIQRRSSEIPNYAYNEKTDGEEVNRTVTKDLSDLISMEAALHYYTGYVSDKNAANVGDYEKAREEYLKSAELYNSILSAGYGVSADRFPSLIFNKINLGKVYFQLGYLHQAKDHLTEARDRSYEFNLPYLQWSAASTLARVYEELALVFQDHAYKNSSHRYDEEALTSLFEYPEIFTEAKYDVRSFMDSAAASSIERGDFRRALLLHEWKQELNLRDAFFQVPIPFEFASEKQLYRIYHLSHLRLQELSRRESSLRMFRKESGVVQKERKTLRHTANEAGDNLVELIPGLKPFIKFTNANESMFAPAGASMIRLHKFQNKLYLWNITSNNIRFYKILSTDKDIHAQCNKQCNDVQLAEAMIEKAFRLANINVKDDTHIALDYSLTPDSVYKVFQRIYPSATLPTLVNRVKDHAVGFHRASRGVIDSDTYLYNVRYYTFIDSPNKYQGAKDIVEAKLHTGYRGMDRAGGAYFDPALWISSPRAASVVIMNHPEKNISWENSSLIYEIGKVTGVSALIFVPENTEKSTQKILRLRANRPWTESGFKVFGSNGFDYKKAEPTLLRLLNKHQQQGARMEAAGDLKSAYEEYRLAFSFSWKLASRKDVRDDIRISLARLSIMLTGGEEGRALMELMLDESKKENNRKKVRELYRIYLESVYRSEDINLAREIKKKALVDISEYSNEIHALTSLYEFQRRLKHVNLKSANENYSEANYNADLKRNIDLLASDKESLTVVEELIRHTRYNDAEHLIALMRNKWKNKKENEPINFKLNLFEMQSKLDAFLLLKDKSVNTEALKIPVSIQDILVRDSDFNLSIPVYLLLVSLKKDQSVYFKFIDEIDAFMGSDPSWRLRRDIYFQWWNYISDGRISAQGLGLYADAESWKKNYRSASLLERSMIFRMFTDYNKYDPRRLMAYFLFESIRNEADMGGAKRALYMSAELVNQFQEVGDHLPVDILLKRMQKYNTYILTNPQTDAGYSRLYLAYHAARKSNVFKEEDGDHNRDSSDEQNKSNNELIEKQAKESRIILARSGLTWIADLHRDASTLDVHSYYRIQESFINALQLSSGSPLFDAEARKVFYVYKQRAFELKNWNALANITFYEEAYYRWSAARKAGLEQPFPVLFDFTNAVQQRLPDKQNFVLLCDTANAAVRMMITKDQIEADQLPINGRELSGYMYEFLSSLQYGSIPPNLRETLFRAYSPIVPDTGNEITYIWLGGIHAVAPVPVRSYFQVYQVMDIYSFVKSPVIAEGKEFKNKFNVLKKGDEVLGMQSISSDWTDEDRKDWMKRLNVMSNLSLGSPANAEQRPLHIQSPLREGRVVQDALHIANQLIPQTVSTPWFIATNDATNSKSFNPSELGFFLTLLASRVQSTGIFAVKEPEALLPYRFIGFYYNQTKVENSLYRRYTDAMLRIHQFAEEESLYYGYRPFTPSILVRK